jgi:5-methyltetrahydrofolate--homocysteine methyltransferase
MQKIQDAVVAGNRKETEDLVRQAISEGTGTMQIINEGLAVGLKLIGDRFKTGDAFLPEMILSAIAAKAGIEVATKDLTTEVSTKGTMVLGTVKGDLHDIGKNLLALVLMARGFKVVDLGVDVTGEEFLSAVKEHKPEFLGLSCLMTTTMAGMEGTIDTLTKAGLRDTVKVLIGGCPVTPDFATQIGADGCARDAASAADLMESLL